MKRTSNAEFFEAFCSLPPGSGDEKYSYGSWNKIDRRKHWRSKIIKGEKMTAYCMIGERVKLWPHMKQRAPFFHWIKDVQLLRRKASIIRHDLVYCSDFETCDYDKIKADPQMVIIDCPGDSAQLAMGYVIGRTDPVFYRGGFGIETISLDAAMRCTKQYQEKYKRTPRMLVGISVLWDKPEWTYNLLGKQTYEYVWNRNPEEKKWDF